MRFTGKASQRAVGRLPRGEFPKIELRYRAELALQQQVGTVLWFMHRPGSLRLANNTHYEPDFLVMYLDRSLAYIDTKAMRADGTVLKEDDSWAKFKIADEEFVPFRFIIAGERPRHGGFVLLELRPKEDEGSGP